MKETILNQANRIQELETELKQKDINIKTLKQSLRIILSDMDKRIHILEYFSSIPIDKNLSYKGL